MTKTLCQVKAKPGLDFEFIVVRTFANEDIARSFQNNWNGHARIVWIEGKRKSGQTLAPMTKMEPMK